MESFLTFLTGYDYSVAIKQLLLLIVKTIIKQLDLIK